jgi:hypothetical protein
VTSRVVIYLGLEIYTKRLRIWVLTSFRWMNIGLIYVLCKKLLALAKVGNAYLSLRAQISNSDRLNAPKSSIVLALQPATLISLAYLGGITIGERGSGKTPTCSRTFSRPNFKRRYRDMKSSLLTARSQSSTRNVLGL